MKLSVAIIAKNEEKTLPKLLESIREVDDIVLVDTGSTDKTIEIAKSYGVRVFEKKFDIIINKKLKEKIFEITGKEVNVGDKVFDFASARNWISKQAKHDMIFMPDCDEIVEWNLQEVEKFLDDRYDKVSYKYTFSFDANGKPIIEFNHSKLYNRKRVNWHRTVHEVLIPETFTTNVDGWMTDQELNFLYQLSKKYNTISEIGSWKGRSTNALLTGCKGMVTAIDHFQGSDEKDLTHGAVGIYEQFLENTKWANNLEVYKMSSEEASKKDEKFEMVFIDGEHTYEGVKKDIELWRGKATKIICGHDYCDAWKGVMKAVDESFEKVGVVGSIWYVVLEGDITDTLPIKEGFCKDIYLKHYQNKQTNREQYLIGLTVDYIINGYNDRNIHYLARELYYKGQYEKAIELFTQHIKSNGWRTEQGQSYIFMGDCYRKLGNDIKAIECYSIGFSYDVKRREGLLGLAKIYYDRKQWKDAEILYRASLLIEKGSYYANSSANYGHFPLGMLSVCLYYQGKKDESLDYLKKAIELDPSNETYNNNLAYY
jgi:glycosyltransferase involved in cell wall biosynthesis